MRLIDVDRITDSDIANSLGMEYCSCTPAVRGMLNEHPPDRKASTDFHRPAYPNYTVEDALKKWGVDTRKGVDAGGATGRK